MTAHSPKTILSFRRKALAASVATFGLVAVLATGSLLGTPSTVAAQTPIQPVATVSPLANPAIQTFSFADMVERVKPAVVSIRVKSVAPGPHVTMRGMPGGDDDDQGPFERFFREFRNRRGGQGGPDQGDAGVQMSQGSGFIISTDGKVVTNFHVVKDAREVVVVTDDGTEYNAKVLGSDEKSDVAVVQVDGKGKTFPTVPFAQSQIRVGDWVLAVGNPFGLGGTVTAGIVSARGRELNSGLDDYLQIDAPINHGNSGGPTFNLAGEVVGMNTAIYSPSGGSVGIGFAIPTETIQRVIGQLQKGGEVVRGWLGVQIQPISPEIADSIGLKEARGALVSEPQSGSPASKAGIKAGDAILAVDGKPVKDARDLARTIAGYDPGSTVKVTIFRDGHNQDVQVTLGKLPSDQKLAEMKKSDAGESAESTSLAQLGLSVSPSADVGNGNQGVTVVSVDPKGSASQKNIKVGDVILEAQGRTISTAADLTAALKDAKKDGRKAVLLRVKSQNEAAHFVPLPISEG